jgi:hypothetical protein
MRIVSSPPGFSFCCAGTNVERTTTQVTMIKEKVNDNLFRIV